MDDMPLVTWDNRYLTGIKVVDDQHKELVNMTNKLYQGCLAGDEAARIFFMKAVHDTVNYVNYHFSAEEKIMEHVNYPAVAEHKRLHQEFVRQILMDVKSFEGGKKFVPNLFVRYLRDWIFAHIAVEDKKYAEYIRELKQKSVPGGRIVKA
jgi:hemerythrin